jgi:hypothetical protein
MTFFFSKLTVRCHGQRRKWELIFVYIWCSTVQWWGSINHSLSGLITAPLPCMTLHFITLHCIISSSFHYEIQKFLFEKKEKEIEKLDCSRDLTRNSLCKNCVGVMGELITLSVHVWSSLSSVWEFYRIF